MGFRKFMGRIRHKRLKIKAEELAEKWNVLREYLPTLPNFIDAEAESWFDYVHHYKIKPSKVQFCWRSVGVGSKIEWDSCRKMIEKGEDIFEESFPHCGSCTCSCN
ncbi:hypothetical protein [Thermococcus sp.]